MKQLVARTLILNPWLWLDLETTGLNPKTDEILSVGIILTDSNLVEFTRAEYTLGMTASIRAALDRADPVVRDMHAKSGLIERMGESDLALYDVVADLHRTLDAYLDEKTPATLAGSTVHFDRAFVYQHAPSLLRHVGHRHLDVSALKVLANAWGVEAAPKREKAHTPIADLENSLAEFRHWRWHMFTESSVPAMINAADADFYRNDGVDKAG